MRIQTEIEETELPGDYGGDVPGLVVTCARCGYEVAVYGTGPASARRGALMLREECPEGLSNFYVADWE
jgi:hypothetical protein